MTSTSWNTEGLYRVYSKHTNMYADTLVLLLLPTWQSNRWAIRASWAQLTFQYQRPARGFFHLHFVPNPHSSLIPALLFLFWDINRTGKSVCVLHWTPLGGVEALLVALLWCCLSSGRLSSPAQSPSIQAVRQVHWNTERKNGVSTLQH